jgi:hypothetical protein
MNLEYEREINSLQKFFYYLLSAHLNIQQLGGIILCDHQYRSSYAIPSLLTIL